MRPQIPPGLEDRISDIVDEAGYASESEFVRSAARKLLRQYEGWADSDTEAQDSEVWDSPPGIKEWVCTDCPTAHPGVTYEHTLFATRGCGEPDRCPYCGSDSIVEYEERPINE